MTLHSKSLNFTQKSWTNHGQKFQVLKKPKSLSFMGKKQIIAITYEIFMDKLNKQEKMSRSFNKINLNTYPLKVEMEAIL